MFSLKSSFKYASKTPPRTDLIMLLLWLLIIDDDRQVRERKKREKREHAEVENAAPKPRPGRGPSPR